MIRTIMIAAVALIISAGPAVHADPTGGDLLMSCRALMVPIEQRSRDAPIADCLVLSSFILDLEYLPQYDSGQKHCAPTDLGAEQMARAIVKQLERFPGLTRGKNAQTMGDHDHDEPKHSGYMFGHGMLSEEWPCN